jgi:predicted enzyme related to lactoylglutathione lyase
MPPSHFIILYVASPLASAAFYEKLLGTPAIEASEGFAMLPLSGGVMLGLWKRSDVQPVANGQPGASEIDFVQMSRGAVETALHDWRGKGAKVLQEPTLLDFGYTATLADPDGHRLRLFCPEG